MTIEEKARRYDQAIKEAEIIHKLSDSIDEIKRMEQLFPELKEPKDERIRKSLVAYFTKFKQSDMWNDDLSFGDILAWFEKQARQEPDETVKWGPQEESYICQLESLVKEQWRKAEKAYDNANTKKMSELMFFLKTFSPDKKSGWNEDDEKYVKDLVGYFTEAMSLLHNEDEVANWLKSLKDRVQPEQEWKKEDEEMLTEIILDLKALKYRDTGEAGKAAYQKEIDWLENRVLPKSQKCIVNKL